MVSAVIALGEQMGGERMISTLDNNAASGAVIQASPRARAILAITESLWLRVAQLAASCWVERVASDANPADAPSRDGPPSGTLYVEDQLESLQTALQLRRV